MDDAKKEKAKGILAVLWIFFLTYYNYILIIGIIIGGVWTMCSGSQDPLDVGGKERNFVGIVKIVNKQYNGYIVALYSKIPITKKRAEDMEKRHIKHLDRMVASTVERYNIDPANIDPYEAIDLVVSAGIPDSLEIWALDTVGFEKTRRYLRPNPNDSTALYFSSVHTDERNMPFGAVFLDRFDIRRFSSKDSIKSYNYKGCMFAQRRYLERDEEFSHIHYADIHSNMITRSYTGDIVWY